MRASYSQGGSRSSDTAFPSPAIATRHSLMVWLVSTKGIQHVKRHGGEDGPGYLKPDPIVFAQHFTTPANTGTSYEPVWLDNMGYADACKR
jgi:hypothetical protein